jgi:hypothetical protein
MAKVRETLAVNEQRSQRFHVEMLTLKKLNEVEGKVKYCSKVSNTFAVLVSLDAEVEINNAWDVIRERI